MYKETVLIEDKDIYLSLKQIERIYDISVETLRTWIRSRKIRFTKIGNLVRIRKSDIESIMVHHKTAREKAAKILSEVK